LAGSRDARGINFVTKLGENARTWLRGLLGSSPERQ